jgi:uncharacterized membrane protein YdjX (TVP38/TMEM64 family)
MHLYDQRDFTNHSMKIPSCRTAFVLCTLVLLCALGVSLAWPETLWPSLASAREAVQQHYAENALTVLALYVLVYTLVGALCLPGTGLLNLTGAGLFGPWVGLTAICFSRAAGGSLACVSVRTLLRERIQKRYGNHMAAVNRGFAKEGGFYLFALRLVPGLPYPITNMAMGLTQIRLFSFFWITLIGSIPGCMVTINAVRQLDSMSTPSELLSVEVVLSLVLIGALPLLLRRLVAVLRGRIPTTSASEEAV